MSSSLAVQPAFRTSKTFRTKANPDRTIFGTSLDNYGKCWQLLNDQKAVQEATDLHNSKWRWKARTRSSQRMVDRAWGLRDYNKPDIGEEFDDGFSKVWDNKLNGIEESEVDDQETVREIASRVSSRNYFPSSSLKKKTERVCKSAFINRDVDRLTPARIWSACSSAESSKSLNQANKKKPMSQPVKRQIGGSNKMSVPRFRLPPNAVNHMRMASLKITETGAKDLINSEAINKIGLGDTLQYNYQAFQRQETPQFYKHNGHVLLLGQHFTDDTTNQQVTAPGGFYKLSPRDRDINERFRHVYNRNDEATMVHQAAQEKRFPQEISNQRGECDVTEEHIPLNIRHKFGVENVTKVLKQNKQEVIEALTKPGNLKHSGMVPPRSEVKELNHPIDPSPAYFNKFGENLKYDKFDGGLHLYIK